MKESFDEKSPDGRPASLIPRKINIGAPYPDPEVEYMLSQGMTMEEICAQDSGILSALLRCPANLYCGQELMSLLNLPQHVSRRSVAALLTAKLVAHGGRTGMWFYTEGRLRAFPIEEATKLALQWRDEPGRHCQTHQAPA